MKIPTSFQLMAHTINVRTIPAARWKHKDCIGLYNYEKQQIEVRDDGGATMPFHTFAHELTRHSKMDSHLIN